MVIADGNLRYAVINALIGEWSELGKKSIYNFGFRDNNIEQPIVSINASSPLDCKICFSDCICFIEIDKVKYRLWYRDNTREIRLELHSNKAKIRLAKVIG